MVGSGWKLLASFSRSGLLLTPPLLQHGNEILLVLGVGVKLDQILIRKTKRIKSLGLIGCHSWFTQGSDEGC